MFSLIVAHIHLRHFVNQTHIRVCGFQENYRFKHYICVGWTDFPDNNQQIKIVEK